jgi:hypothetical protein
MRWGRRIGLAMAAAIVVGSLLMPTLAWARYRSSGAETNVFLTHVLAVPTRPSCSGLGVLSVTLNWTNADAKALTYELGQSAGTGGPYSYADIGAGTSTSFSISSGAKFYVVRAVNHQWHGSPSIEREVDGILFLAATCP